MFGKNKKKKGSSSNGTFERQDMTGSLFENDKKEKESQPDMTGVIQVHGEDLRIAAWMKESKSGKEYLSISISEFDPEYSGKSEKPATKSTKTSKKKAKPVEDDEDDDDTDEDEDTDETESETETETETEEDLEPPKRGTNKRKTAKK